MAEMIPDSLGQIKNPTKGETKVHQLFKKALLPDKEWWVWYEPVLLLVKNLVTS